MEGLLGRVWGRGGLVSGLFKGHVEKGPAEELGRRSR